jgi:hypothetical protein
MRLCLVIFVVLALAWCLVGCSHTQPKNPPRLRSPKGMEQVESVRHRKIVKPTLKLPHRFALRTAALSTNRYSAILTWDDCGGPYEITWGTNSGVYQWTNEVTGTNVFTVTNLIPGVTYYFSSALMTNCVIGKMVELVFPVPVTNYDTIYLQTNASASGTFRDNGTVLARMTNSPTMFYRLRAVRSQTP